MYYRDYRINSFDVDKQGNLTIPALFGYLQDIMLRNANSYGAGSEYHQAHDLVWVLVDYEINIYKLPHSEDILKFGTIPYSFKRFYGFRKYKVLDKNNNIVAEGHSKFILINFKTKEIVSPSSEILALFTDAIKEPTSIKFVKHFKNASSLTLSDTVKVKNSYIDINNHMNNVYSILLAYNEFTEYELEHYALCTVRVTYKKEAFLNDELSLYKQFSDDGAYFQIKRNDDLLSEVSFRIKKIKVDF
ncbi:MAG: thioesterase [Candidatus Izemoplasma sp.]